MITTPPPPPFLARVRKSYYLSPHSRADERAGKQKGKTDAKPFLFFFSFFCEPQVLGVFRAGRVSFRFVTSLLFALLPLPFLPPLSSVEDRPLDLSSCLFLSLCIWVMIVHHDLRAASHTEVCTSYCLPLMPATLLEEPYDVAVPCLPCALATVGPSRTPLQYEDRFSAICTVEGHGATV